MVESGHWPYRCLMLRWVVAAAFGMVLALSQAQVLPRNYAVEVSAQIGRSPAQISLSWVPDANATNYTIWRRSSVLETWRQLSSVAGSVNSFLDSDVQSNALFEYQVLKKTSAGYSGAGYVASAIDLVPNLDRGRVLLMVENVLAGALQPELQQLESDLVGEGWTVALRTVDSGSPVATVRDLIKEEHAATPVRTVFLIGHTPVAYSGNINPDGHANHRGAWPADVYFSELNSNWTDSSVTSTNAERDTNWNVPGDGKFDQSTLPSDVDVEIGRVDLSDLTCFSNKASSRSELDLMRQYFAKDHAWRSGKMSMPRRGLILDVIGIRGRGPLSDGGWRNFTAMFGSQNVVELTGETYFSKLTRESFLWTYAAGGGTYTSADGVGTSDDFALSDVRAVFTMFIGSYFGDWNEESNFLRAALGSGNILTASWSGYPHWFVHHMALGETIGFSARLTQNNATNGPYLPSNGRARQVHVALMGDPTLRMHPFPPPPQVTATDIGPAVTVRWLPADSTALGYHVLRAPSQAGPFQLLTSTGVVQGLSFSDSSPFRGGVYMVRAVRLEDGGSGTYVNASAGTISAPLGVQNPPIAPQLALRTGSSGLELLLFPPGLPNVRIDESSNLVNWTPLPGASLQNPLPGPVRFYRARVNP
jgi:hypothetical protein